jgi:ribosomal protein S27AE
VDKFRVECLSCGARRVVADNGRHHADAGECPQCGYVGWAASEDVTATLRRQLREHPLERRRLRTV